MDINPKATKAEKVIVGVLLLGLIIILLVGYLYFQPKKVEEKISVFTATEVVERTTEAYIPPPDPREGIPRIDTFSLVVDKPAINFTFELDLYSSLHNLYELKPKYLVALPEESLKLLPSSTESHIVELDPRAVKRILATQASFIATDEKLTNLTNNQLDRTSANYLETLQADNGLREEVYLTFDELYYHMHTPVSNVKKINDLYDMETIFQEVQKYMSYTADAIHVQDSRYQTLATVSLHNYYQALNNYNLSLYLHLISEYGTDVKGVEANHYAKLRDSKHLYDLPYSPYRNRIKNTIYYTDIPVLETPLNLTEDVTMELYVETESISVTFGETDSIPVEVN